jgi:uncharacterized membrane protein
MNKEERAWSAVAHILAAVPLWGLVVDSAIWLYFKESNERVAFHALQAIFLQTVFLILFIVGVFFQLFYYLVKFIASGIGELLLQLNVYLFFIMLGALVAISLFGAWNVVFHNEDFTYPVIGSRLRP